MLRTYRREIYKRGLGMRTGGVHASNDSLGKSHGVITKVYKQGIRIHINRYIMYHKLLRECIFKSPGFGYMLRYDPLKAV